MSLFNSGPGQPFSSNYSSSMNFGNPFNRANTSNTGMSNPFPGSSLSGPGSLFPASGSNNLFGNTNTGGGGTGNSIWGNNNNSTNANSNLFRSNTMPQNMFGSGSNTSNLFSANNTNTAFPRSNSMLNTGSNFMGTSNSGMSSNSFFNQTSHGYGTRGTATIDKGSIGHKHNPSKTHEGIYVYSITHDKAFSRKCLDEIRAEDYAFMKAGQVPEGVQKMILANKQAVESGTMGMGSNQGVMVGSSSNNLFGNNTNTMGGMGGSMGMNTNNPFANTMQKPNNWFSGGNTNNNLFQNTNNSMMNSSGSFSFSGGMQNSNSNMSGNNLFAQNSGPNFFNNNQNQGNFMNQQNTSASNMFAGGNKFQSNSGFPQSGGNNLFTQSTGANNNLFQNRQNSVFPTGNMPLNNNNLFNPNRNPPPSLFPNQTQPNNPLFPQQNQSAGGHQQLTFMNQPPNTGSGANPHLFPPQGNFPGAFTGFPQQQQGFPQFPGFYPQGQQGFVDGMNPNPSLFPPQPGQMGFQQGPFQQYPSMQHNMHDVSWNGMGYQTNAYTPYQPYQEEKQTYTPRQTLTEAILSLDKKMTDDEKGSPRPGFTYFPYNPFEKKHRKADISEKENIRNTSLLRPGGSSLIRRDNDEDAFSLIKKSRYVEDDVEIIMRPKLFLPTGNRNRSTSPASSRSRDYSGERTGRGMSRNIYNDSVNVTVNVMLGNDMKKSMEIRIYRQSSILALKVKILEKLRESNDLRHESTVSLEELANKCAMFTDSKMLRDVMILSAVGIVDGSNVCLQVDEEHVNEELKEENRRRRMAEETQIPSSSGGRTSLVSRHVPKLTKEGYYCIPSIEEMSRMSDKELTMIEGFIVGNAHGKVEFEGRTDVRDLDLDDIVVINPRAVEVYPEERYPTEDRKPIKGEKLNKPAMITLFDCFFKNKGNGEDVRKKFAEKATRDGFEFIDYDSKNGVYRLRIPHF